REILNKKISDARKAHRDECKSKCINDFVKIQDKFVLTDDSDDILFSGIKAELESLQMDCSIGSTDTKWLTDTNLSYTWTSKAGKTFSNEPVCLNQYKCIQKLLEKINSNFNVDLNSCLVTYYRDGTSGLRPHSDNEKSMDPLSPICVFSVGSDRQIRFFSQYQSTSEEPLLSVIPGEGSLYIMEPGCQSFFVHQVPSSRKSGPRFSLSFRKRVPDNSDPPTHVPVTCDTPKQSTGNTSITNKEEVVIVSNNKKAVIDDDDDSLLKRKNTTVLFGTSITREVFGKKLGVRGRKCINVSKSGAKIPDISEMLDNFYNISNDVDDVEKVIFSFGTNVIKHERFGVAKFREPVAKLI
ncbi:MAG: alpha-ketoglutarate-dependent dioxygenase AlkB, partial [Saccharospirillaceae bacterium]|nr:alpha-ketoglutarate-dependent dioxygenase AlkB [Saccharospirillaceae bacterium]